MEEHKSFHNAIEFIQSFEFNPDSTVPICDFQQSKLSETRHPDLSKFQFIEQSNKLEEVQQERIQQKEEVQQERIQQKVAVPENFDKNAGNNNQPQQFENYTRDDHNEHDILSDAWFAVFDTETTGTSSKDVVIQMCLLVYDKNGSLLHTYNEFWKLAADITINPMAEATHKISKQMLDEQGIDPEVEIVKTIYVFQTLLKRNISLVAHNASFDNRLLKQTAQKYNVDWPFDASNFFCTQKASRQHVQARDKLGKIKAPSNLELYMFFEHMPPEGDLHDAFVDCKVTATGFINGSRAGWWL